MDYSNRKDFSNNKTPSSSSNSGSNNFQNSHNAYPQQQQFQQQQHIKVNVPIGFSSPSNPSSTNTYPQQVHTPSPSATSSSPSSSSSSYAITSPITNEKIYAELLQQSALIKQLFDLLISIQNYLSRGGSGDDIPPPKSLPSLNIYLADTSPTYLNDTRVPELQSLLQKEFQINARLIKENDTVEWENSVILFPARYTTPRSPSSELIASGLDKYRKKAPIIMVCLLYTERWGEDSVPTKPIGCEEILHLGLSTGKGIYVPKVDSADRNNIQVVQRLKSSKF